MFIAFVDKIFALELSQSEIPQKMLELHFLKKKDSENINKQKMFEIYEITTEV